MMTNPRKSDILIIIATEVVFMSGVTVINSSIEKSSAALRKAEESFCLPPRAASAKQRLPQVF